MENEWKWIVYHPGWVGQIGQPRVPDLKSVLEELSSTLGVTFSLDLFGARIEETNWREHEDSDLFCMFCYASGSFWKNMIPNWNHFSQNIIEHLRLENPFLHQTTTNTPG